MNTTLFFILLLIAILGVHSRFPYVRLSTIYVTNLQLTKCDGTSTDPVSVENVSIHMGENNHFLLSGTLYANEELIAPIKASVTLKKKTWVGWLPIPCEDNIGSCDYHDICSYGYPEDKECPQNFIENKVPCRCPLPKGNYTLPPMTFGYTDMSVLTGKYKGNVYITHLNERLACYNVNFVLRD